MLEPTALPEIDPKILEKVAPVAKTPWLLYGETSSGQAYVDYPKRPEISAARKEELLEGDLLLQYDGIKVIHPREPMIKETGIDGEGGMHLRIVADGVPRHPKTPEEWRKWHETWSMAFCAAKVSTEGESMEALWQNFKSNTDFSADDKLVVELFARGPKSPNWGKTLPLPTTADFDFRNNRMGNDEATVRQVAKYTKTLNEYFRIYWLPAMKNTHVFENRPQIFPPNSPKFVEKAMREPGKPYFWKNELMFFSDSFNVEAVYAAHVSSGVHLMVPFADAPRRPWEDAKIYDGLVAAEVAAQILEEHGLAANTVDTLTASWFGGFKGLDKLDYMAGSEKKRLARGFRGLLPEHYKFEKMIKGKKPEELEQMISTGTITQKDLQRYDEYRKFGEKGWATSAYFHVYGVRKPDELMEHFAEKIDLNGPDWEKLRPIGRDWMMKLKDALNADLPERLKAAAGPIVPQNS